MGSHKTVSPPSTHGNGAAGGAEGAAAAAAADLIGYVDVHVHSARGVQNICIYHKQDVYAKLSLPGDGGAAAATPVVNGGGRNPVFDQSLRLGVRAVDVDAALRCEVWMLSRVKNYLQDQLLGFALVPLPDVVAAEDGTLDSEFPLSSTDLFHSPAGFVQLSLSYIGVVPEVVPISPTPKPALADAPESESTGCSAAVAKQYEKIEFPDLNLVEENQMMVSEYFRLPGAAVEPQCSESLLTSEDGDGTENHDAGVRIVESFSTTDSSTADSVSAFRTDTPISSPSPMESPTALPSTPLSNSEPSANAAASPEHKKKVMEAAELEVNSSGTPTTENAIIDSSGTASENVVIKPVINVNIEQEVKVDQKEIVDMYMKSMQQFTESLAKMKLPMDFENGKDIGSGTSDADSSSGNKTARPQDKYSKVFYGSRAFF